MNWEAAGAMGAVPVNYVANTVISVVIILSLGLAAIGVISSSSYLPAVSFLAYGAAVSFVRVFLSVARSAAS